MAGSWSRTAGGGRGGRRAVTRIEKLVEARASVERALDQRIVQAVVIARRRGVPWSRIARALGATSRGARRRYRSSTP